MAHPAAAPALADWAARPAVPEPTYQTLLAWVLALLRPGGAPRPLCKRLAVLIGGLLADEQATLSSIAAGIHHLAVSPAREPSILRRLERLLDDPRLEPGHLLGAALPGLLPLALGAVLRAASAGPAVRLVVDETTLLTRLHVLVIGLGVPGLVLPLAVRCWRQNAPLGEGQYWVELSDACWQVQRPLPPELRRRVLLLADRAYGVPHLLDLAHQLGWHLVVRVQGRVKVRLDGRAERTLRELVPAPGRTWSGGWRAQEITTVPPPAVGTTAPVAVFKKAGWRTCQVVAAWAVGEREPWLVLTTLPARPERLKEYALRWAIERLFLSWKSHGWDVEAGRVSDPARLSHLVSGLALATWWRLALALPAAEQELARLRAPRPERRAPGGQLPLPWAGAAPAPASRPWVAKFSLLSWGRKVARGACLRQETPALRFELPDWPAQTWTAYCIDLATLARST